MNLKCIVTGTGRSGSVYAARLLTSLGMPCGHESIFDWQNENSIRERLENPHKRILSHCSTFDLQNQTQIDQWVNPTKTVAESSYLAVPCLHWLKLAEIPIVHIVRDPIKVVTSFVNEFKYFEFNHPNQENPYNKNGWENKIYEFLPSLNKISTPMERACYFYTKWNETIEQTQNNRPYFFSQLESLSIKNLCNFLNLTFHEQYFKNTKINSKRSTDINFQIRPGEVADIFFEICKKYGYESKPQNVFPKLFL